MTYIGLLAIGVWLTVLVTRSLIFYPLRNKVSRIPILAYFTECPLCMGTWIGFLVWVIQVRSLKELSLLPMVSLSSYIVVLITDTLIEVQKWLAHAVDQKPPNPGN
jgi:hypothetical protein